MAVQVPGATKIVSNYPLIHDFGIIYTGSGVVCLSRFGSNVFGREFFSK